MVPRHPDGLRHGGDSNSNCRINRRSPPSSKAYNLPTAPSSSEMTNSSGQRPSRRRPYKPAQREHRPGDPGVAQKVQRNSGRQAQFRRFRRSRCHF